VDLVINTEKAIFQKIKQFSQALQQSQTSSFVLAIDENPAAKLFSRDSHSLLL